MSVTHAGNVQGPRGPTGRQRCHFGVDGWIRTKYGVEISLANLRSRLAGKQTPPLTLPRSIAHAFTLSLAVATPQWAITRRRQSQPEQKSKPDTKPHPYPKPVCRSQSQSWPRCQDEKSHQERVGQPGATQYQGEARLICSGFRLIVIERLTKNVTEDHLRDIFGQYGEIRDLDLPINRQGTNRGTAYILYVQEPDAESAIAHMHEGQIDGATVNVSIVLPRRKFSPEPPGARRGNPHIDPRHIAQAARVGGLASTAAAGGSGSFRGSRGRGGGGGGPPAGPRGGRNNDVYRPSSRSKSPDAGRAGGYRSRSPGSAYSNRSESRSRRRGGGGARRETGGDDYGRRRSPSRDSYSSYGGRRSRSRSQSRGRGGRSYR
uniref:RRM domain-containing protein n=1 Tax=Pyricularia oryzae (strain 70-15 / ATCC MYA-4617 / FGSC 8958) TaxID=242507 RepID=Q2KGN9_PYRO7|nr:hypothetical protein MGCH7_ch7g296 [Pyricularia oryzae 70-15]